MDQQVLKEIGLELKKQRKEASLTIEQVAKKLKIRKAYLQGLEKGDVSFIPFEAYVIGYIKHYSKLLGLDSEEYVKRLKSNNQKIRTLGSKNIITDREFMPSMQLVLITMLVSILIYAMILFVS
jgi:cytoskeletal protein RodZ